jgi:hypothetical protein
MPLVGCQQQQLSCKQLHNVHHHMCEIRSQPVNQAQQDELVHSQYMQLCLVCKQLCNMHMCVSCKLCAAFVLLLSSWFVRILLALLA